MKKLVCLLLLATGLAFSAGAQDSKTKVKATSTVPQKVHNTFSKHKRHSGYVAKHERNGHAVKHKVNYKKGKVETKVEK